MKILVTGGMGFIGSHTVVELVNAGHTPIIIDTLENSQPWIKDGIEQIIGQSVTFYKGDCADRSLLNHIAQQEKHIDGVIHFAAYKAVGESVAQPLKYYRNNIGSLIAILEWMEAYNFNNLVFSSSCTVYGQPDVLPVTEQSPIIKAQSPYGNTKQICEEIISDYIASGKLLSALSLRYFNPIGAHPSAFIGELPIGVPGNLVPFVTQTAVGWRKELSIFGNDYNTPDGTCIRDFIHVVDLAVAHVKALEFLHNRHTTSFFDYINLGTGLGVSVLQVVNTFEQVTGVPCPHKFVDRRPGDVEQIYASVEKAAQVLGWRTKYNLAQSLADAWRWQKALDSRGIKP